MQAASTTAASTAASAAAAGVAGGVMVGTVSAAAIEGVIALSMAADLASLGLAAGLLAGQIANIPEPKIKGKATEEQRAEFKKTYDDLRERILNKPECAKLFGGAARALRKLARAKITLFSRRPVIIRGKSYFIAAKVVGRNNLQINTHGGLFAGAAMPALNLGHELGHLLNIYGKDEWDNMNPAMSARNTAKVFNACFK